MNDKSDGFDLDRQAFVRPEAPTPTADPRARLTGFFLVLAFVAAIALGYRLLALMMQNSASADNPELAQLDQRLAALEGRLDKLEATRRTGVSEKKKEPIEPNEAPSKPTVKTTYQISPPPEQQVHTASSHDSAPDPDIAQRLSSLRKDVGEIGNNEAANHEAWQATTDRLADMAGQVGTQDVEILRNQDELNQLLARTQMQAIPFELLRGSNPQPVGPVSLRLESSNPKSQRYTLCVYFQPSCIQLKDRTLHEVVQFLVSRDGTPLEVIATKITKNQILGYLEVPRAQSGR
jgi:hypothetical protein